MARIATKSDGLWHFVSSHSRTAAGDPARVQICLLGSPRILVDGNSVTRKIRYRKGIAVLSRLAVECDVMHPRERIAALLWPNLQRAAALTNLRQVLSNLVRVLTPEADNAPQVIRSDSSSIGLYTSRELSLDIHALNVAASGRGTGERMAVQSPDQPPLHSFLEGFDLPECQDYSAWLDAQRRKFDNDIIHLHEKAVAKAMARHDLERALLHARLIERIDPLLEPNQVCLMRLLMESGRSKQALLQYERFTERLREDLDVEPEPATSALQQHILQRTSTALSKTSRPKWYFEHTTNATVLYVTCDDVEDALPGTTSGDDSRIQAREILQQHSSRVVQSLGLGQFAYFDETRQGAEHGLAAINAARALMSQLACAAELRIGIYSGQIPAEDEPNHVAQRARATELARRLGFIADNGDIILCADTLGSLALEVEYLGEWRFRGIDRDVHAFRLDPA